MSYVYTKNCINKNGLFFFFARTDNTHNAVRARAVILLCKMIADDPIHAAKLLPLIVEKMIVNQQQIGHDSEDSEVNRVKNRIMQVLLLLQPILETVSILIYVRDLLQLQNFCNFVPCYI